MEKTGYMKKRILRKLELFGILVMLSISISGKEYFVGLDGNDSNTGAKDSPFASIFKASEMAMPGEYRDELNFDFVPEKIPAVKLSGRKWKYEPSPWYGAFQPLEL